MSENGEDQGAAHAGQVGFELTVEGHDTALAVLRFEGMEALSELFQVHVTFSPVSADAIFKAPVGSKVAFTIGGDAGGRTIHGIASRIRQVSSKRGERPVFRVTLVPRVYALAIGQNSRIFQDQTTADIVAAVLNDAGLSSDEWRFAIDTELPPRPYCVQFRESDWSFISRLLEEEGIHYFFEQHADGGRVVFADSAASHEPMPEPEIRFVSDEGTLQSKETVTRLEVFDELVSGKVTLRDYNFEQPQVSLEAQAAADVGAQIETFDFPGLYDADAMGTRRAKALLEERQAMSRVYEAESNGRRLRPGSTLTLADAPFDDIGELLIASVDCEGRDPMFGSHDDEPRYASRVRLAPAATVFRPARVTPRPRLFPQTAVVVGPDEEEIHTDAHGRVKVRFFWDRRDVADDTASTWLRVSQPWAGAGYGAMFLPRVGHEVIVDFLDGDPDRPIVVGSVYHAANVPPNALPDNKTKTSIKSFSSPEGEAGNELTFEDKKDEEEVYLHAQKCLRIGVEADKTQTVGKNESLAVTENRTITVGGDASTTITGANETILESTETLTVTGEATLEYGDKLTASVTGEATLDYADKLTISVGGDMSESITGARTIEVQGEKLEITCGGAKVTISQSKVEIEAPEVSVKGTASVKIQAEGEVSIKASGQVGVKADGMATVEASGIVKIKGAMTKIN